MLSIQINLACQAAVSYSGGFLWWCGPQLADSWIFAPVGAINRVCGGHRVDWWIVCVGATSGVGGGHRAQAPSVACIRHATEGDHGHGPWVVDTLELPTVGRRMRGETMPRNKYSDEFKADAVELYETHV